MQLISIGLLITGLLWFLLLLWRFPAHVGLFVVAVVILLDSMQISLGEINAGVTIYQDDLACAALIAGGVIAAARNRTLPQHLCLAALLLLGLAGLNFLRGASTFGLKPAGNGVRGLVFLIVPFLAISVIGPALKVTFSRATTFLCGAAFLLTGVALCRWGGILPMPEAGFDDQLRQIPRVLAADYPMIIGQALIAVVGLQFSGGVRFSDMLKATLLGAVVLVSQHRSVWFATAAGLAWLAYKLPRYVTWRKCMQVAASAAAIATTAFLLLIVSGRTGLLTSMLKVNIDETRQEDSTFAWRLSGFGEAIERTFSGGVLEITFGPPSGRDLSGTASEASTHIHNRYVDTVAYYGLLGLLLLLAWFWMLVARIRRMKYFTQDRTQTRLAGPILEAILVSELIYFLAYFGNLLHGVLLGLLWVAASATTAQPFLEADPPQVSAIPDPVLISGVQQ